MRDQLIDEDFAAGPRSVIAAHDVSLIIDESVASKRPAMPRACWRA